MRIAVTGAFSYAGKYITRRLLQRGQRVITLTGHPRRADPFGGQVDVYPLDFENEAGLRASLVGAQVLVNTYWIRFDLGRNTQTRAVEYTRRLIAAAVKAGVQRIVHISITNPSLDSTLPYFRGKAANEAAVKGAGTSYAILRPTVLFGTEDILINNIAFLLRRFPVFFIPGDGGYQLQPIYVDDMAELVEQACFQQENCVLDAVGPETFTFRELVSAIGRAIRRSRRLVAVPPRVALLAAQGLGALLGDVLLTPQEVRGLMQNLLVSSEAPRGTTTLSDWLRRNQDSVGVRYASELRRHYAPD